MPPGEFYGRAAPGLGQKGIIHKAERRLALRYAKRIPFSYVQSLNVLEKQMRHETISQDVYENKALMKKCQDIIENAKDRMIFDPCNSGKMLQIRLGRDLTENKQVISCDVSVGQYVEEKAGDRWRPRG
jgi:hypothetical protein